MHSAVLEMDTIATLYDRVSTDEWRRKEPFSPEMSAVHERIGGMRSAAAIASTLNDWLASKYQPCLFGRIAAHDGLMRYCVLLEEDLRKSDGEIREQIQHARTSWWADAFNGRASGFVIAAVSERLVDAVPDTNLLRFAQRLCRQYLLEDIEPDRIYADSIYLEKPGPGRITWKWNVGVNYFGAAGDGRWWRDHRIPGGVAFSMNSVGHMVKAGVIGRTMAELDAQLGVNSEGWDDAHVDSLGKALVLAMRTINGAAQTPSGPATRLYDVGELAPAEACPIALPKQFSSKNHCEYFGQYHTDYTLPSEYFRPDVDRPADVATHTLDFTYLFDASDNNLDFRTMGDGVKVRVPRPAGAAAKTPRTRAVEVSIEREEPLARALGSQRNG